MTFIFIKGTEYKIFEKISVLGMQFILHYY